MTSANFFLNHIFHFIYVHNFIIKIFLVYFFNQGVILPFPLPGILKSRKTTLINRVSEILKLQRNDCIMIRRIFATSLKKKSEFLFLTYSCEQLKDNFYDINIFFGLVTRFSKTIAP